MSIYKRGEIYHYGFAFAGQKIRQSTKQTSATKARQMEAAHLAALTAQDAGRVGKAIELECSPADLLRCAECERFFHRDKAIKANDQTFCGFDCGAAWEKRHTTIPTLGQFIASRFQPWAQAAFENADSATWRRWYKPNLKSISAYPDLADRKITEITSEHVAGFAAHLQSRELVPNSINSALRVLRRVFTLAIEWGAVTASPKIAMVGGAAHRDRVITDTEQAKYLAACPPLLLDVATLLADTGMRPDECLGQKWENIAWVNGRSGSIRIEHGKTLSARRTLPMTPRVRALLENRWIAQEKPESGWIFPSGTKSKHAEPSTICKQHRAALKASKVRPFVLYSFRHTFATKGAAAGWDSWTMTRIMGWSNVAISKVYIHPSDATVLNAMNLLPETQIGHKPEAPVLALTGAGA